MKNKLWSTFARTSPEGHSDGDGYDGNDGGCDDSGGEDGGCDES